MASGCCSKLARELLGQLGHLGCHARLMTATLAGHRGAHGVGDSGGGAELGERRAAWMSAARSSTRRWRPPRRKAAAILERDRPAPKRGSGGHPEHFEGVGAWPGRRRRPGRPGSTPARWSATGWSGAGRDHTMVWWARARTLTRFDGLAVAGHQAVVVAVGADHVGQHLGVTGVGLGPRGRRDGPDSATSTSGSRRRPGSRPPPRRPTNRPRSVSMPTTTSAVLGMSADELVEAGDALHPFGQRALARRLPSSSPRACRDGPPPSPLLQRSPHCHLLSSAHRYCVSPRRPAAT